MESLPKVKPLMKGEPSTLDLMLVEQRKTNELLLMLIEAMGQEDSDDPDAPPAYYMDGSPVRG